MSLETSHHAGLMSLVEHIFPLGCNTADTQSEGAPRTPGKQGLELRLSPLDSWQEEGQDCLLQNKGPGIITSELALGDGFMC